MTSDGRGLAGVVPGADPGALAWLLDACRPVAERFAAAGHEILLVGGMVRDLAAGREVHRADIDLTTSARPDETLGVLEGWADAVWRQGERFGTIGAQKGPHELEITTFRADAYDPTSRKPIVTFGHRVEDDLARRDFTVNAMALALPDPRLVDPHGGLDDLRAGRLRTPLAAEVSFSDDPLRMLRAARFAAGYDLDPDDDVVAAATRMSGRLSIVSVERIHDELGKLLSLPDPSTGLRFLAATGLAAHVVPELGTASDPEAAIGAAVAVAGGDRPDPVLRLVVLLLALGGALDGAPPAGAGDAVAARARALRSSATDVARARRLAHGASVLLGGQVSDRDRRAVAVAAGDDAPAVATVLTALAAADEGERFEALVMAEPDLAARVPVVDGDTVMARTGLAPGPEVGAAIAAVREERLRRGPLTDDEVLAVLDAWRADRSDHRSEPPPA